MPVTIKPAKHEANAIKASDGADTAVSVLENVNLDQARRPRPHGHLIQSSFDGGMSHFLLPRKHGFVDAATTAYSAHHHLVIRPDDIWISIITQFSVYVNAHAEELRGKFVAHQGQKALTVEFNAGSRFEVDFAHFATRIGDLIEQNIVDPDLRSWILPAFTTTTPHDEVVASIVMMGTLQAYFKYYCMVYCGIPTVTLLGEREDYELLLRRVEKLREYGEEPTTFCDMLRPILQHLVRSFDEPEGQDIIKFWQKICHAHSGSGFSYYTGWITAFCFWNSKGKQQVQMTRREGPEIEQTRRRHDKEPLYLDNIGYGSVDMGEIPDGFTKVPVVINDHGEEIESEMLAGSIGISCSTSGKLTADGGSGLDPMKPEVGWFIYEKNPAATTS